MPPMGGAQLSPSDVAALAAYLAALNQRPSMELEPREDDADSGHREADDHGQNVNWIAT